MEWSDLPVILEGNQMVCLWNKEIISLVFVYSLSRKTVNSRENFWNVYYFATNQKRDETAKFTTVQVFRWRLLSYKKIRIEKHQSQPTSMTLWTAREAQQSAPLLIGSLFLLSDALSNLVSSYLVDSTSLSRIVTKHIIHIYSLHVNKLKYKRNNFSIWKR